MLGGAIDGFEVRGSSAGVPEVCREFWLDRGRRLITDDWVAEGLGLRDGTAGGD